MGKTYDLNNKSDMRKFEKDLTNTMKEKVSQAAFGKTLQLKCPNCGYIFSASIGHNVCPMCKKSIDLNPNF